MAEVQEISGPVRAFLAEARRQVDQALGRFLPPPTEVPSAIHEAMRYSTLAPGKRIRPALCLATGRALGAADAALLPAACALEMIHAFSLIHDDLPAMDDDDLRRGRPTNHVEFGEAVAILAGDALSVLAFDVVARTPEPDLVPALVRVLARDAGTPGMIGGQVLDIQGESREPDLELVKEIHRRKTAALIRAACEMGAVAARAPEPARRDLARFGELTGLAFQVQDDILDETASSEAMGKETHKDAARGKQTYPTCAGLDASRRLAEELVSEATSLVTPYDRDGILQGLARFIVARSH